MMELSKETKLYELKKSWAKYETLPIFFVAKALLQTAKAVYLYGHGSMEAQSRFGCCCKCGLTLSHPGSILLGIGPVCAGNWGLRDKKIKDKSKEEIDRIIGDPPFPLEKRIADLLKQK